jgi:hypothetical protein
MTKTEEYLKIVLEGYSNTVNRRYLSDYFIGAFREKERDSFVSPNVFYDHCLEIITGLRGNIEEQYRRRKQELVGILEGTNKEYATIGGEELKRIVDQRLQSVESCSINDFNVSWNSIAKGYFGAPKLCMKDLLIIKDSITKARALTLQPKQEYVKNKVLILAVYYLKKAKYLKGSVNECISKTSSLFSKSDGKLSYYRKLYYKIGTGKSEDSLTAKNLVAVIALLEKYPRAKEIAEKELYSFE